MLVDDEKDVGRTYELILKNHGFDVDYFTDSTMALEHFKPNLYDLTILDIKMPDPNGFKLYDQIKSRDSKIKTLFITALNSIESYNTENKRVYPARGQSCVSYTDRLSTSPNYKKLKTARLVGVYES